VNENVLQHAEIVADHCLDVDAGDEVLVLAPPAAEALVLALYRVLGERNAQPTWLTASSRGRRELLRAADVEALPSAEILVGAAEAADAVVTVKATRNDAEQSDVPQAAQAARQRGLQDAAEAMQALDGVLTLHPTPAAAQQAEMSTPAYEEFVWSAVGRDWAAQGEHQSQLVDLLDGTDEIHVTVGDKTDLTLSVDGMVACNDTGEENLPGGEVFTAPHPDSVEGEVVFDLPVQQRGSVVEDARLVFEEGEVVEFSAARNEETLAGILDTDDGARRVGEIGFGMNRDIDRLTGNMLFDEKTGDSIHLALGRAIEDSVPEGVEANESAVHVDMLFDVSEDSEVRFDGEVVQRDGRFVFEDGF
jgi:aminopeptidase